MNEKRDPHRICTALLLFLSFFFGTTAFSEELECPRFFAVLDAKVEAAGLAKLKDAGTELRARLAAEMRPGVFVFRDLGKNVSPEIVRTAQAVYDRLHSPREISEYLEKLTEDVVANIKKNQILAELKNLQNGKLTRNAVLRVLVQRARDRGETLGVIVDLDFPSFFSQVAKGPFFDKGFKLKLGADEFVELHGIDTHLIQRDIVARVVEVGAGSKAWYGFLGSKEGQSLWLTLYDFSPAVTQELTSPSGITTLLGPYLNTR